MNILGMSPNSFRKIFEKSRKMGKIPFYGLSDNYGPELELTLYFSNFSKEVSQQETIRHTSNSDLFGNSVPTSQECLQKISERYIIQKRGIPILA